MVMDILVCNVIIVSAIFYGFRGFAMTLINVIQWIISAAAAFYLSLPISDYFINNTGMGESIAANLKEKMTESVFQSAVFRSIPELFEDLADKVLFSTTAETAQAIMAIIVPIIVLVVLTLIFKLILSVITFFFKSLKRQSEGGVSGAVDTIAGGLFGGAFGLFFVLLIFSAMVPMIALMSDGTAHLLSYGVTNSHLGHALYNSNYLLDLMNQLLNGR